MTGLVLCPADRAPVAFLARERPLALVPLLGPPLLDLWLAHLAGQGATRLRILAADRPEQVRAFVRKGEKWGLAVEVVPEQREADPAQARDRHASFLGPHPLPAPFDVVVADRVPGGGALFEGYPQWLALVRALMPAAGKDRVGMRQPSPGVFVHTRARVSPSARLQPPCWVGANAWVGPLAVVGPDAIVEEAAFVDERAEVSNSFVGPATYVGALTEVRDSLAWGRGLLRYTTGSFTEIVDPFLLGDLAGRAGRRGRPTLPGRFLALLALVAGSPAVGVAWLRRPADAPLFQRRLAVRTPTADPATAGTVAYHELPALGDPWRRWHQLWNVLRGDFAWVGNRPLSPVEAGELSGDFERLWLAVRTGLVSLGDAEGCAEAFGDDARAHASFYAVRHGWREKAKILARTFGRAAGLLRS